MKHDACNRTEERRDQKTRGKQPPWNTIAELLGERRWAR